MALRDPTPVEAGVAANRPATTRHHGDRDGSVPQNGNIGRTSHFRWENRMTHMDILNQFVL